MGNRRLWTVTALVAAATVTAAFWRPAEARLTDLSVYLGAVSGLADGDSLYDFTRGAAPFTYPPFAALLFMPLTWPPILVVQVAWTLATLATVVTLAHLATKHARPARKEPTIGRAADTATPQTSESTMRDATCGRRQLDDAATDATHHLNHKRRTHEREDDAAVKAGRGVWGGVAGAALLLTLSAPVSSDVKYGQVSLFLAALVVVDVLALRRTGGNGVLLGMAAAVKLTPLIFIPLLWFSGRRRAAVVAVGTFAGCAALGAIALPGDSWRFWGGEGFQVSRLGYVTGVGNQSFNGALMRLDVPEHARTVLVLVIGGAVAVAALLRGVRLAKDGNWLGAVIVVGAASVVLSPVSWTHHQIWLVLAALLPVDGPGWARLAWPITVLALMILPVTALEPLSESRLLLAVAVAALVPLRTMRSPDAARESAPRSPQPAAAGR
ncbi:DUF2029 domain-containing protein [Actinoplanes sp. LDG1-06]|uniref:DUF2029 domain-containing protein n=1 Tax=Paractinoplanes ovalisporus TaxID=2810368 RepID=A0ABS2ANV9_9ACTN|nr:glycosyltransferase 87 family protein [Actinoplanes ovalisporus]MBM2621481.1 DUF2029 domain-containing protein [Actinoplanes ovalisporus]